MLQLLDVKFEEGVVGTVIYRLKLPEFMADNIGIAHRGALASLTDVIPYFALYGFDQRPATSLQLTTEFLNDAPVEEDLICVCRVLKLGKANAFTDCTIMNPKDSQPLVKGTLTINFVEETPKL
ncbi:UNKNOWN [Stylonychia lemnae]|uniref:Thioesterase domain-containing protein n=1 Tax=Stylonychia lemnae TaxID=5949 RepID=A0A078B900_STYLE|nr:UNKNOWN [Stylonychia lemnae]|eukprot:CDW90716.1 UNKNOWN [Stylonychia lemnae]